MEWRKVLLRVHARHVGMWSRAIEAYPFTAPVSAVT